MKNKSDWKQFGIVTFHPTEKSRPYLYETYWNKKSKYTIVTYPYTRHFRLKPYYDVYEIPTKFIDDENMIYHLKNPLATDLSNLQEAINYIETLEKTKSH